MKISLLLYAGGAMLILAGGPALAQEDVTAMDQAQTTQLPDPAPRTTPLLDPSVATGGVAVVSPAIGQTGSVAARSSCTTRNPCATNTAAKQSDSDEMVAATH